MGAIMVVRDGERGSWRRLEEEPLEKSQGSFDGPPLDVADPQPVTTKRPRSRSSQDDEPDAKRAKVSASPPCLAPAVNHIAQAIFDNQTYGPENAVLDGTGDIFLTEGFRQRWCRCEHVSVTIRLDSVEMTEWFAVSTIVTGTFIFARRRGHL
jgi:E3 ubiquitin-protein ligase UBR7